MAFDDRQNRGVPASNQHPEEPREAFVIGVGKVFPPIFLIGAAATLWYGFAPDISNRPLGSLTISDLTIWLALALISIWLLRISFRTATDEAAELWGYLALLIILGIVGFIFYASRPA